MCIVRRIGHSGLLMAMRHHGFYLKMYRALIKSLIPTPVRRWLRMTLGWQWFIGNYASWAEARAASQGYDAGAILERVRQATIEVRAGRAAFERDGVAFHAYEPHPRLVAALRVAAEEHGGRLEVVDFGGALGSTWWHHRGELAGLPCVRWRVVEQPHYVALGQREFCDETLSFHESIGEAMAGGGSNVILLSCVIPYVEEPMSLLREIVDAGFAHVIIDRNPFVRSGPGRLVVQRVPPALGGGSYPSWLFERNSLLAPLKGSYSIVDEWPSSDAVDKSVEYRGLHLARQSHEPS